MARERTIKQWVRGFWAFYREYTSSAIHTASAAALAIFGLLIFIDPLFAAVAIVSYVGPPLVLYSVGAEVGPDSHDSQRSTSDDDSNNDSKTSHTSSNDGVEPDPDQRRDRIGESAETPKRDGEKDGRLESDADSDSDDGDTDSDSDDGDTDSDSDDGDTDSDSDDGDTDSDSDSDS
ncbi:hypothetical protein B1756_11985 [Natrarchaeobaculum aegyptiacum]|uniref:Uncharacterized protein n=1 Tax=Natrarchaeobaculum aegyptiacum TaxID=745377 RepID=A0A2Z2HZB2_9EURY|nr:hypothetical protein B1756_11985 [Natrarchaeobaculum aegyptiacum]